MNRIRRKLLSSLVTLSLVFVCFAGLGMSVSAGTVTNMVSITATGDTNTDSSGLVTLSGSFKKKYGLYFNEDDSFTIRTDVGTISRVVTTHTSTPIVSRVSVDHGSVSNGGANTLIISGVNSNTVTVTNGRNNDGCYVVSVEVTITDTYNITTAPTASAITYGQTLSQSTLTGGAATWNNTSVPGTFAWTDGTIVPEAGTASYSVTFTPTEDGYSTDTTQVSVTVNRATNPIITPPTANNLVYDGNPQQLVTGGTAVPNAVIQYSLDGTAYSTDIPVATDPGVYNVYYKVDGGAYWDALDPRVISVSIAPAGTVYQPLYQLRADSSKFFMDVYVPYVGTDDPVAPTVTIGEGGAVTLTEVTIGNQKYGRFTLSCAAKNMTDDNHILVTNGGDTLFEGDVSVASYLSAVIKNAGYSQYHGLAVAMLRYGAAAQLCLNYKTDDLANNGVPGAEIETITGVTIPQTVPADTIAGAFNGLQYSSYYGMNMTYTYDTTLLIAFRIADGKDAEALAELQDLFPTGTSIAHDSTNMYYIVSAQNIPICRLGEAVFTVNNVQIIPTDYLSRIASDASRSDNLRNLCRALYAYYCVATGQPVPTT